MIEHNNSLLYIHSKFIIGAKIGQRNGSCTMYVNVLAHVSMLYLLSAFSFNFPNVIILPMCVVLLMICKKSCEKMGGCYAVAVGKNRTAPGSSLLSR